MSYKINFNSTYANRGMGLENDINETNKYYLTYDIALIYKKPTPIRIRICELLMDSLKPNQH